MLFKTKTKLSFIGLALLALLNLPTASAAFIDFGTLDVHPVNNTNSISKDWFIEYLKPGQKLQQQIEISNFSQHEKNLKIYIGDADKTSNESIGAPFFVKNTEQKSEDLNNWISLPVETLKLEAGESKKLSVNFNIPNNAGVGLHSGAIIVKETVKGEAESQSFAMEKGVRVYLNVTGPAITSSETTGITTTIQSDSITSNITVKNTGTTDYTNRAELKITNIIDQSGTAQSAEQKIRPLEEKTIHLEVQKPDAGLYQTSLTLGNETTTVGTIIVIPLWAILLLGAMTLFIATKTRSSKVCKRNLVTLTDVNMEIIFQKITSNAQKLIFQKSVAYFVLLVTFTTSTLWLSTLSPLTTQAQTLNRKVAASYDLTIKWGDFRKLHPSSEKEWSGELSFTNAEVEVTNLLHFERTDSAQLTQNGTSINYSLTTGPDNDGMIIHVTPTTDESPTLTVKNSLNNQSSSYSLDQLVNRNFVINNGLWGTYLNAELGAEHVLSPGITSTELSATPEIEATPEPVAQIPELENLFTEELPATPEVLADFVLSSDYVEEINLERKTNKVETDPILIDALEATPEVLAEIAATPDLNFIFIPTKTVDFPAQEFSFEQEKTTTENLGTLIFVQNKEENWNTYVSTTDFVSLSGNGIIPASALTVIPGEPTLLSQDGATIDNGNARKFSGTADKTLLVEVTPGHSDSQAVFVLNPRLEIKIPAGTLPGRYRGTLTITSL